MRADCLFVSAGCSAENEVVDVGSDGLVVYGAGANVVTTHITVRHPHTSKNLKQRNRVNTQRFCTKDPLDRFTQ